MNGFIEPLPGLLDDPQVQSTDLPTTDFRIAPLRNPAPLRNINPPSPLEPLTDNGPSSRVKTRDFPSRTDQGETRKRNPKITPTDVILARDAKKPNLTIQELVEASTVTEFQPTYLPSFVSLAVVERSPVPRSLDLDVERAQKRLCVETGIENASSEDYRRLPLPEQSDGKSAARPLPLLPAMVTGLHEPPLSAALLPSMHPDSRPRSATDIAAAKKMKVKTVLESNETKHHGLPPELMLNSPEIENAILPGAENSPLLEPWDKETSSFTRITAKADGDQKPGRRIPKKWTDLETEQLMLGVQKYGIGKWKQILNHPGFDFGDRSTVDLKDRFRVCQPGEYKNRKSTKAKRPDVPLGQSSPSSMNIKPAVRNEAKPSAIGLDLKSGAMLLPETEDNSSPDSPLPDSTADASNAPSPHSPQAGKRRKRRPWTHAEDEALMRGVARHGFQWTLIHHDQELGLSHRRATDLRDRIRNRFPDGYKHAETAPLRSERIKEVSEKTGADITGLTAGDKDVSKGLAGRGSRQLKEAANPPQSGLEHVALSEYSGLRLPPLALDDGDWNGTLPPMIDWEEMGI